ncbi:MAG: cyanophycinase [Bryobacteraceae bacterium]|nr:cyanophycinase [Bryobacteraceae bacterium]
MKFAFSFLLGFGILLAQSGPAKGHLVIAGGGPLGPEIVNRFIELAGGPTANFVIIPTADDRDEFPADYAAQSFLAKAGAQHVVMLHTRNKADSDTDAFAAVIRNASGVWFPGGRHWRLVDSYLNTKVHRELMALLDRGGVIGGTSAGATIQGSFMVRGARSGNTIMVDPTYQVGLGFIRGVAIDQHLLTRKRERDMIPVVEARPELLGIGLDEGTAIIVTGNRFTVAGVSKVAIYEHGKPHYFLAAGDEFDLKKRSKISR